MTRLRMLRAGVLASWILAAIAVAVYIVLDVFRLPPADLALNLVILFAAIASIVLLVLARREEELVDYLALRDSETDEDFTVVREGLQQRLTRSRTTAKVIIFVGIVIAAGSIVLAGFDVGPVGLSAAGSVLIANGIVGLAMLPTTRPPEVKPD